MRKIIVIAAISLFLLGFSGQSMAGIHIGVNIPLPPVFVFSAPPELVVIPGTYVYYCPNVDFDIFFYAGYWYRPYGGYWYRSGSYGGPWVYTDGAPSVLVSLPHDYRIITRGYRHIPYSELHRNWRAWERGRYWEHHNWGRPENERHQGLRPSFREGEHQRYHGVAPQFREGEHQRHHGVTPQFKERGHGGSGSGGGVHEGSGARGGGGVHGGAGHEGHEKR